MAKPRVFVSSTYYDLKSLRADLEHFIKEKGYDSILNERGNIPYTKELAPEDACYREIESCDILVSIIGGRRGSNSNAEQYSISQMELKTAIDQNKQVYVFVDRDVSSEYRTYLKNKGSTLKWAAVDDVGIYEFLEEVYALPNNNAVMAFETSHEIVALLREQWAGLFQRLLQQAEVEGSLAMARELRQSVEAARQLVDLIGSKKISEPEVNQEDINAVLLPNHPSFARIRKLLNIPYRVYYSNLDELNALLKVRNFKEVAREHWDVDTIREWFNTRDQKNWDLLKISDNLFDELGGFNPNSIPWNSSLITREKRLREDVDLDHDPSTD
jgi:hypothetical protein